MQLTSSRPFLGIDLTLVASYPVTLKQLRWRSVNSRDISTTIVSYPGIHHVMIYAPTTPSQGIRADMT